MPLGSSRGPGRRGRTGNPLRGRSKAPCVLPQHESSRVFAVHYKRFDSPTLNSTLQLGTSPSPAISSVHGCLEPLPGGFPPPSFGSGIVRGPETRDRFSLCKNARIASRRTSDRESSRSCALLSSFFTIALVNRTCTSIEHFEDSFIEAPAWSGNHHPFNESLFLGFLLPIRSHFGKHVRAPPLLTQTLIPAGNFPERCHVEIIHSSISGDIGAAQMPEYI